MSPTDPTFTIGQRVVDTIGVKHMRPPGAIGTVLNISLDRHFLRVAFDNTKHNNGNYHCNGTQITHFRPFVDPLLEDDANYYLAITGDSA